MITLSNEKGLVKAESWEQVKDISGFRDDLNSECHKLKAIIGRYIFKDNVKCGLSNCHTLHAKGYIATTTDGLTTNIGKDCGKKYFGVDFETLSKKFDQDFTESENRERLWNFSFQLDEFEEKIIDLRKSKQGANWVFHKTQELVSIGGKCPDEIIRHISAMVKARTRVLSIPREATDSEIEIQESIQNRKIQKPYLIDERISEIDGFEVLYPENNLKELLVTDLENNINLFRLVNIDTLSFEELRDWIKWVDSIESTLKRVIDAKNLGVLLLTKINLEHFSKLIKKNKTLTSFNLF